MSDNRTTLLVENASKSFGDFNAVQDLSFQVQTGRVFGFLGPNGAGKTTTIRMIVGITKPDSGRIELLGHGISGVVQDRIGYLPEERGLYKKLKVIEQLKYFAALKGISGAEAGRRIDKWLERMELSAWKDKKTTDLSKGMQQKIQFIATVLHEPDLLILDEPFSGLDPINVEFMIGVIDEIKKQNKTIIFSTHLMETAERLCHDILLINRSRKVLDGSLREIKEKFGRRLLSIRVSGGDAVLTDTSVVKYRSDHADETDIELMPEVGPQRFLRMLIDSGAEVHRFVEKEPKLNDIFIDQVAASTNNR